MDRRPIDKLTAVSKYDPNASYEWDPEDLFTVTGAEIDAWNKALALMVQASEFQRFVHIQRGAMLMSDFIKQSVEQGLMRVRKPEEKKVVEDLNIVEEVDSKKEPKTWTSTPENKENGQSKQANG